MHPSRQQHDRPRKHRHMCVVIGAIVMSPSVTLSLLVSLSPTTNAQEMASLADHVNVDIDGNGRALKVDQDEKDDMFASCTSHHTGEFMTLSNDERSETEGKGWNNTSIRKHHHRVVYPSTGPVTSSDEGLASECGLWFSISTIPNAGLGIFAGRAFEPEELLQPVGDVVIPLIDVEYHARAAAAEIKAWPSNRWGIVNREQHADHHHHRVRTAAPTKPSYKAFLDDYTWNTEFLFMHMEGRYSVGAASPGLGAAVNCILPLSNVHEGVPHSATNPSQHYHRHHRSRDPGAGASSAYHDRRTVALRTIAAGEELFAYYGDDWFESRTATMGYLPRTVEDLDQADQLLRQWESMYREVVDQKHVPESVLQDLWEIFIRRSAFQTSHVLAAIWGENDWELLQLLRNNMTMSLTDFRVQQATRSIEWLEQHGRCGDHLTAGPSSTLQAGQGAYARRDLPAGTVVAPLPLLHITNRDLLQMFAFAAVNNSTDMMTTRNSRRSSYVPSAQAGLTGYQLLLNYCFGHAESSLLLCPYGPMTSYINHNQSLANVHLRWADPTRSRHCPELLLQPVESLDYVSTASLAMELVALRDIVQGEEIWLDYGDSWEYAWQQHVVRWGAEPVVDLDYVAAWQHNQDMTSRLRTTSEQLIHPYRDQILLCSGHLQVTGDDDWWRSAFEDDTLDEYLRDYGTEFVNCDIVSYRELQNGTFVYTVQLRQGEDDDPATEEDVLLVDDVPRAMIRFFDAPYASDIFLPNAFRHDMHIPDDLFPKAWRNRNGGTEIVD